MNMNINDIYGVIPNANYNSQESITDYILKNTNFRKRDA